jgi:hypothetical protein
MSRRPLQTLILLLLAVTLFASCKKKQQAETTADSTLILNEQLATEFAQKIEMSVLNEAPDFYNDAFDKKHIREVISAANSIVASAFDTQVGRKCFDATFLYGDFAVGAVQDGGDFRFLKYYEKDGEHHVIFRIYNDYGLHIDDCILTVNEDNEVKIKDAYTYNLSSTLTDLLLHDMLYCSLKYSVASPDETAEALTLAEELFNEGQFHKLLQHLQTNKELLKGYRYYNHFYINALYETSTNFIHDLEKMEEDGLDIRCILLHEMIYYTNKGKADALEPVIQRLIDYTGEDPIYWMYYGKALANGGDYAGALKAYNNAQLAMPAIWDIWQGQLDCHYHLRDKEAFNECLSHAEELFGMSEVEVREFVKKEYPRFESIETP